MEDTDRVSSSCLRRGAGGVTAAAAGAGGGSSAVTMLKLGLRPRLRLRDFLRVNILVCSAVLVGMYAVNVMGCCSSGCCLCSSLLPFFENWQLLFVKQVFLDTCIRVQVVHNVLD